MAVIEFEDVEKVYDDGTVGATDVNLTVNDGEFLVLVGPSGCGKTTTLELVAGLQRPTDGTIRIDGKVVNDVKPQKRGIAMVFQNYALYPHKTVRQNLRFGLKYTTDLDADEMERRVQEIAELLGIEALLDQKPKQLSGGQQQRVALGRAIVRDPEVFLLDEPLSNLDAKLRTEMRAELQRLQDELDVTTVYVTHDQTEAMTMGDRIVVMNDGRVQQVGTPTEVYNSPANDFVAGFIGSPSINFVEGRIENGSFVGETFTYEFGDQAPPGERTAEMRLGIRPEDLSLSTDGGVLDATVTVVEELGSENIVYLDIGDGELVARVGEQTRPTVGDTISASFERERAYLFDESGAAVKHRQSGIAEDAIQ